MIQYTLDSNLMQKAIQTEIKINAQARKENNEYKKITAKARIYSQKFGISYDDVKLILFELDSEKRMSL